MKFSPRASVAELLNTSLAYRGPNGATCKVCDGVFYSHKEMCPILCIEKMRLRVSLSPGESLEGTRLELALDDERVIEWSSLVDGDGNDIPVPQPPRVTSVEAVLTLSNLVSDDEGNHFSDLLGLSGVGDYVNRLTAEIHLKRVAFLRYREETKANAVNQEKSKVSRALERDRLLAELILNRGDFTEEGFVRQWESVHRRYEDLPPSSNPALARTPL